MLFASLSTLLLASCGAGLNVGSIFTEIGFGWYDGVNQDGILQVNAHHSQGADQADDIQGIVYDGEGSLWLVGHTKGSLGGPNSGNQDAIVIKMDSKTGILDTSFGNGDGVDGDGILQFNNEYGFDAGTDQQMTLAGLTSDRKLVLVGHTDGFFAGTSFGTFDLFVIKIDADTGELDTSFNGTGYYRNGSAGFDTVFGGLIDSSDNIYVIGSTNFNFGGNLTGAQDGYVLKLKSNGTLDVAFGNGDATVNDGIVQMDSIYTGGNASGIETLSMGVLVDQDLFVVGITDGDMGGTNAGGIDTFVVKMSSESGFLDANFGDGDGFDNDGIVQINPATATLEDTITRITYDPHTGSIFLAGYTAGTLGGTNAGGQDAVLIKLSATSGALSSTFGNGDGLDADGILQINAFNAGNAALNDSFRDLVVDDDGYIIAVGGSNSNIGGTNSGWIDAFAVRVSASNGSFDTNFGSDDGSDNDGIFHLNDYNSSSASVQDYYHRIVLGDPGEFYCSGYTKSNLGGSAAGDWDTFATRSYTETGLFVKDE